MENSKYIFLSIMISLSVLLSPAIYAASEIGKVIYVRGVASATEGDVAGKMRILGRNATLFQNDVINVNHKSFAMIKMIDGTKMTLRPNTQLKLSQYDYAPAKNNKSTSQTKTVNKVQSGSNVLLHLLRGGFRSITGAISKSAKNNYKIRTSTATIGIRGTEFDARICVDDCLDTPGANQPAASLTDKKVVGRVAFMRGNMTAKYKDEKARTLKSGAPLYEGDAIVSGTNGYGVLAFSDKSRITLTRNSEFHIKEFEYLQQQPKKSKSVMELVRGGLRALTGLIAQNNRNNVKFKVSAVTIGIRGTGFDIVCNGLCNNTAKGKGGMNVNVWKGKISLDLDGGELLIAEGQSYFIANKQSQAKKLSVPAKSIKRLKAPRPDKIKMNHDDLFGAEPYDASTHKPGLYVSVYDGFVEVKDDNGTSKGIGAGESIHAIPGRVKRLSNQPSFQVNDVIPRPGKFDPSFVNFLDFINQDDAGAAADNCTVN